MMKLLNLKFSRAVHRLFEGTYCLHLQGRKVSHASTKQKAEICICYLLLGGRFAYSSTLRREAVCSTETSVNLYHRAWHHISGQSFLQR
jgi:hypothetical protein